MRGRVTIFRLRGSGDDSCFEASWRFPESSAGGDISRHSDFAGPGLCATQSNQIHGFWVAGSSSVTVKADEAILFLAIPGSAEDAAGALAENDRITRQVEQVLVEQGLRGKYRFTANQFLSGGALSIGPALAAPMAMTPRPYLLPQLGDSHHDFNS